MNSLQDAPIQFASKRELEREISRVWGEKDLAESKVRWLQAKIVDLQLKLKEFHKE